MLGEAEREIELGAGPLDRLVARAQPRQIGQALVRRCGLERQHDLEQRMPRQRTRRVQHLDQPLERQVLVRVGGEIGGADPADQLAEASAGPERSVRSTSVLTKKPIRSSSAASVRPAIGLPIAMSVPAPSRLSKPRQRRLQHHEQARARIARASAASAPCSAAGMTSGTWPPRWLDIAGRGRSAGNSIWSGKSASADFQNASCRAMALSASPSWPSSACCHKV